MNNILPTIENIPPKDQTELYFDRVIRTQKGPSILSFIHATYHSWNIKKITTATIKDEIRVRLKAAYDLFRDNVDNADSGSGSYVGLEKQFASQYTIALEMGLWHCDYHLNVLAEKVADNRITLRDYFDIFFYNYVQPVNNHCIHVLYQFIKYMIDNNVNCIEKSTVSSILGVHASDDNIRSLFSLLDYTNLFSMTKRSSSIIYIGTEPLQTIISRCNLRYISDTGYDLFKSEITNREEYIEYIINTKTPANLEESRIIGGQNILYYGVPGAGKSWTLEHADYGLNVVKERVVFHPDYTNADFIGQILPVVDSVSKQVCYEFVAGPFTRLLAEANKHPGTKYVFIIEEINRGNASAIFGDIFQLLDRVEESSDIFPIGTSRYGIHNINMATAIYGDANREVRIPSNVDLLATMNTSDQNVFTLDTAFQRRWQMRMVANSFKYVDNSFSNMIIADTGVTWQHFCETINDIIVKNKIRMGISEDKRLGVYFVSAAELKYDNLAPDLITSSSILEEYDRLSLHADSAKDKIKYQILKRSISQSGRFAEKVFKYLWDDVFKFSHEIIFDTEKFHSSEDIVFHFMFSLGKSRFDIFNENVKSKLF